MCVHERELDIIGDLGFNGERDKMVIFIGYHNSQLGPASFRIRASFFLGRAPCRNHKVMSF